MKDAFGGAFILRIMLVFFVVFISFMVIAINFARTFRVTHGVISIIERYWDDKDLEGMIDTYVKNKYSYVDNRDQIVEKCEARREKFSGNVLEKNGDNLELRAGVYSGVCIIPVGNENSYHYDVTSYIVLKAPILNLGLLIPISGESKTFNNIFT